MMPKKFREKGSSSASPLNLTLCALCLASVAFSCVLVYRGLQLEARVQHLEERMLSQEPSDVLYERLRSRLEEQFNNNKRAFGFNSAEDLLRRKRDLGECNCPAGREIFWRKEYILYQNIIDRLEFNWEVDARCTVYIYYTNIPGKWDDGIYLISCIGCAGLAVYSSNKNLRSGSITRNPPPLFITTPLDKDRAVCCSSSTIYRCIKSIKHKRPLFNLVI